jgi:hypothetical protein
MEDALSYLDGKPYNDRTKAGLNRRALRAYVGQLRKRLRRRGDGGLAEKLTSRIRKRFVSVGRELATDTAESLLNRVAKGTPLSPAQDESIRNGDGP